jgi:hypothetical protein
MIARSIHKPEGASRKENANADSAYVCQIEGCARDRKPGHLMCLDHWRGVPEPLQERVVSTYRRFLAGTEGIRPYMLARLEAIIHVSKLHGIDTARMERELEFKRNGGPV